MLGALPNDRVFPSGHQLRRGGGVRFAAYAFLATAAAAALLFTVAVRLAPVMRSGKLLEEISGYKVEQVRLLGLEPYVDVSFDTGDLLTALALGAVAAYALIVGALLYRRGGRDWAARSFALVAGIAAFLALDETLAVHETVGHNLWFLSDLGIGDHPDDVVLAFYGCAIGWLAWDRRELALRFPRPCLLLFAGGLLAIVAIVLDMRTGEFPAEEGLELAAAGLLGLGVVWLGAHYVRDAGRGRVVIAQQVR